MTRFFATALAAFTLTAPAQASSVTPFTNVDPVDFAQAQKASGAHGVELKREKDGDLLVMLNTNTHDETEIRKKFSASGVYNFSYDYGIGTDGSEARFVLWQDDRDAPLVDLVNSGFAAGTDAVGFRAKFDPDVKITSFGGESVDFEVEAEGSAWPYYVLSSKSVANGFTLGGTFNFDTFRRSLNIEAGSYTPPSSSPAPIPVPAALPLLLAGLGGLMLLRRYRRS